MRIALADAGDTLDDANFSDATANAAILRLFTQAESFKKIIEIKDSLRTGEVTSFADRVFQSEINKAIKLTDQNYEIANYRAALQTGLWDLQTARDNYRNFVGGDEMMHRDLTLRFIEIQALLLTPIAPHFCEFVWELLGKKGFIVSASWTEAGEVDEKLLSINKYFQDQLAEFRVKLKYVLRVKDKKQAKKKANSATIFICTSYPAWKNQVIQTAKDFYNQEKHQFSSDNEIVEAFKNNHIISPFLNDAMSFFAMLKTSVKTTGLEALSLTTDLDERKILEDNIDFIQKSLELNSIKLEVLSEAGSANFPKPPTPGSPVIHFFDESGQRLT